jgi:hypothetical protein
VATSFDPTEGRKLGTTGLTVPRLSMGWSPPGQMITRNAASLLAPIGGNMWK